MRIIDLRSDTVTLPTPEMRQAMFDAALGDDVFEEDPTAIRLQTVAAARTGKAAALLVPSGTMANLVAVLTHCGRGDEVILGDQCHTFRYEAGGIAALGGVHPFTVRNQPNGDMHLDDVAAAIRPDDVHFPRTRLICLENTHNRCRGAVLTPDYTASVARLAADNNLALHIDGARIFNAAVALRCDVRELTRHADSVSFCLSKGLAAPVGSLICGSEDFIARARRIRKSLGGGMRQCGVIAAAGLIALEKMVDRLADDHANARRLAEGLAQIRGLSVDLDSVKTNMVYFNIATDSLTPDQFVRQLDQRGVKCLALGTIGFRMVTHYGIEPPDIDRTLQVMRDVMKKS